MTRHNRKTRYDKKGLLGDRGGAIAVWTALMMVSLLGITALVLDMGFLWVLKSQLQATADASALAGAARLTPPGQTPDVNQVKSTAVAFAGKNMPAAPHGTVLLESDVILGHWDGDTRTFTPHPDVTNPPGGETTNAVKTTTRRAEANDNPVPLFFARILGVYQRDVVTSAIAEAHGNPADCMANGVVAGGQVLSGSTNQFVNSVCIHGELGVKVGSQNDYSNSYVSMPDLGMLLNGSDNIGIDECFYAPPAPSCVLGVRTLRPELADNVAATIAEIQNDLIKYVVTNLPDNVEITAVSTSLPSDPTGTGQWGIPGTAYVIDGKVDINSWRTLDNIVIVASEGISIGSNYSTKNSIIASRQRVQMGSWGFIGQAGFCDSGEGAVAILAEENVLVGSNTDIHGGQIVAGQMADLGSNKISAHGLAVQAVNDVKLGSELLIEGCPAAQLPFGPTVGLNFWLVN